MCYGSGVWALETPKRWCAPAGGSRSGGSSRSCCHGRWRLQFAVRSEFRVRRRSALILVIINYIELLDLRENPQLLVLVLVFVLVLYIYKHSTLYISIYSISRSSA